MKKQIFIAAFLLVFAACAGSVFADVAQAVATTTEGAVEFPVGLVKLVGGAAWTIGEVIILPFRVLFG